MSLFGPIDDSDRRRWQHTGLNALRRLIKLGHERKLPPILWELPTTTAVTGRVGMLTTDPRGIWEVWVTALTTLCGPPTTLWPEHTNGVGKTRLVAKFGLRMTGLPTCDVASTVVLIAEFYVESAAAELDVSEDTR